MSPIMKNLINIIKSLDTTRENRVPPGQKLTAKWPVLHYGEIQALDTEKWTFRIWGEVKDEKTLTFDEFMKLPRISVFSDIHCVTGWSKLGSTWEGISTSILKDLIELLPTAKCAMVHGAGGFTTNLLLDDFFGDDVLFAMKHDGSDLTPGHGYPVRLVVPRLYFWKSAKWVTGVEFVKEERPGFWEGRGYHIRGDPWKEERYSKEPEPYGDGI